MSLRLSLLEKSFVDENETAEAALSRTVQLAQRAEQWGFHRFWLTEHHHMSRLAGSAPEVLIAHLLGRTHRIRLGSGGVMLQHYSPYKVAETFNVLSALGHGRVDLGVGKAPGGLPHSTRALQNRGNAAPIAFADLLRALDGYLSRDRDETGQDDHVDTGSEPEGAFPPIAAMPRPRQPAPRFLLGASVDSAMLAARIGWGYVHASHINGDGDAAGQALDAYRAGSPGGKPILAVAVVAAGSRAAARALVAGQRRFRVTAPNGRAINVGSEAQAAEYIRQAGGGAHKVEEKPHGVVHGTGPDVLAQLHALAAGCGVDEVILDTPLPRSSERLASIAAIAAAAQPAQAA